MLGGIHPLQALRRGAARAGAVGKARKSVKGGSKSISKAYDADIKALAAQMKKLKVEKAKAIAGAGPRRSEVRGLPRIPKLTAGRALAQYGAPAAGLGAGGAYYAGRRGKRASDEVSEICAEALMSAKEASELL
jgi:hypothetical protein